MIKLMPTVATVTKINDLMETSSGKELCKICIVLDNQYYWCACFGGTAKYLSEYAKNGSQLFLEDWLLKVNERNDKQYYDFYIYRCQIVRS